MDCDPSCTKGCIANGSCSLCDVDECPRCKEFGRCDTCMLKCDLPRVPDCNNNICTCPTDGDYWWSEIEGCYPFCASSYDFNELRRECQKVWGLVFDVRFGSFASAIELFPSGIIVSTSSVKSYNEDPDGSPIPVRFRGVYYGHPNNPAYHLITGC